MLHLHFQDALLLLLACAAVFCVPASTKDSGNMCSRCSCNRKHAGSYQNLVVDCSRRGADDVQGLLPDGGSGSGKLTFPSNASLEVDILRLLLDYNSIRHLKPFPPLEVSSDVIVSGNVTSEENDDLSWWTTTVASSFKPLLRLELSLRHNHLSALEPGAFASLSDYLWSLNLSDNDLTYDVLPASVFRGPFSTGSYEPLGMMEKLDLSRNKLHALDAKLFEHFSRSLRKLNLQGNPFGMSLDLVTETALSTLKGLRDLNLADTGLSVYPEGLAHALQSLEKLRLDGNGFISVPSTLSYHSDNLIELTLNRNPIRSINTTSFPRHKNASSSWSKLQTLNIVAMPHLEVVAKGAFENLPSLEILRCAYNRILVRIDQEAFRPKNDRNMEWERWREFRLKEVELQDNALHWLSPDLLPWSSLESADLQGNPWLCDCSLKPLVEAIRMHIWKRNPNLSVGLHCAAPPDLNGVSILTTYPADEEEGDATAGVTQPGGDSERDKDPYSIAITRLWSGCETHEKLRLWSRRGALTSALAAVAIAALLSVSVVLLLVCLVRRSIRVERLNLLSGDVRYVRAPPSGQEEDDEYVIMDMRLAAAAIEKAEVDAATASRRGKNDGKVKNGIYATTVVDKIPSIEYSWPPRR